MKKIVVVGGGSAGVMTAYTLKHRFPKKQITIVESKTIATVGVGESTLGAINNWLGMCGIKDKDFMKHCDASYKMSIRFENFYNKEAGYFHYPFGQPDISGNHAQLNDWHFKKIIYPETPMNDYADSMYPVMALVNQNKITDQDIIPNWTFKGDVAYHFDAIKFANWLKKEFKKIGGKVITGSITKVHQDETGIASLYLDTQKYIKSDLFIDCTGFKSLLLGQAMKEPFESFENMLPNNSAWATHLPYTNKKKELKPFTNCTAIQNGWVWNIPLWSRMGTGYVYSDKYISDDDALKQFQDYLGRDDLTFKKLKMRIGIHKNLWVKNVCAIGLSAGFIEPLESNGLLSVHDFLSVLTRTLERPVVSEFAKQNFNLRCHTMFRGFAEFVAMHYALSIRTDTEYWRDIQKRKYPLEEKFTRFQSDFQRNHRQRYNDFHYPTMAGINAIATGMHWGATDLSSLMYHRGVPDAEAFKNEWLPMIEKLEQKKKQWTQTVKKCPTLYNYLKRNIYI